MASNIFDKWVAQREREQEGIERSVLAGGAQKGKAEPVAANPVAPRAGAADAPVADASAMGDAREPARLTGERKTFSLVVSPDEHVRLKMIAIQRRMTVSGMVRRWIAAGCPLNGPDGSKEQG